MITAATPIPLININVQVTYFLNMTTPTFLMLARGATATEADAPLLRVKCSMDSAVNTTKKNPITA